MVRRARRTYGRARLMLGLAALLLLTAASGLQAFTFSFPFPGSSDRDRPPPGPPPWQFRPQDPSNARGAPPGQLPGQPPGQMPGVPPGQMPGQYPGTMPGQMPGRMPGYQPGWPGQYGAPYAQQPQQPASRPPRLELELGNRQPYVQENVLLHLRVVSDTNLETAVPELPNNNDVLMQRIQGPTARARTASDGRREIVNEFVFALTPLRSGEVELPPISVSGTQAADPYAYGQSAGRRYTATSREDLRLQVRPAMAAVQPWLPLQDLSLKATLDSGEEVEEGQPITLVLELSASGATGAQLPSLEPFLRSPDFRVYREQTLTSGEVSSDGRRLEGKRTEYYTLVPGSGGKLQLPEIRLPWWNVTTGTREYAGLPIRTLLVEGRTGPFGFSTSNSNLGGGGMSWFWLPVAGLLLLVLGYWAGVWYKGREHAGIALAPLRARIGAGLRAAGERTADALGDLGRRLDPTPRLAALRPRLSRALPPSTRFLMCLRAANRESDPVRWCERFQESTCRHLRFDSQARLPGMTGRILSLRPGADRAQVKRLMEQLDAALYGRQDIDFPRWKQQFRRQVGRRRGLLRGDLRIRFRRPLLPELNPSLVG